MEHHAFFRLIRVSHEHPQATVTDFFSLGSRFRYRFVKSSFFIHLMWVQLVQWKFHFQTSLLPVCVLSSGRTAREASKEASSIKRAPPAFVRRPSRRQMRRNFPDHIIPTDMYGGGKSFETTSDKMNVGNIGNNGGKFETKSISVPQPAYTWVSVWWWKHIKSITWNSLSSTLNCSFGCCY